jgi:hypothetical protein
MIYHLKMSDLALRYRAFCTTHPGGGWWGQCHPKNEKGLASAEKDAKEHTKSTGHKTVGVVEVDKAECPPE